MLKPSESYLLGYFLSTNKLNTNEGIIKIINLTDTRHYILVGGLAVSGV
jgi:hypothetical protein